MFPLCIRSQSFQVNTVITQKFIIQNNNVNNRKYIISNSSFSIHIEAGALDVISQLLQRKVQHDVNDFDNHLDDLTCDWDNPQINKLLDTLTAAAQDKC